MESTPDNSKADTLNDIGVLKRREIEARIVAPLIERFAEEFGEDRVVELARETVVDVARGQGAVLADAMGGNDLAKFADFLGAVAKVGQYNLSVFAEERSSLVD